MIPGVHCSEPFLRQQIPKIQHFAPRATPKKCQSFKIKTCSKNQKFALTTHLKARSWYLAGKFLLTLFAGPCCSIWWKPVSRIQPLPRSCPKRILGNSAITRKGNSYHFHFKELLHPVLPPSPTSKISRRLKIFLVKTWPNSLGRSWKPSTDGPERQLHSWTRQTWYKHLWRPSLHETTSHLCFLSEACLYPHSSLMMPTCGLLQRKMARKHTHKARNRADLNSSKHELLI